MSITIYGEAGVAVTVTDGVTYGMNYVARTPAALGIRDHKLRFAHLEEDTFTYTVRLKNAKGLGTVVPRIGQELHVFEDSTRVFKGHVMRPTFGLTTMTVTAVGPWWWMKKISLSGENTDTTGGKADRTSFVLPQGPLGASLRLLINRAVDMGVPMAKINTDEQQTERLGSFYPFLKTTLTNMSFASAFAEMIGACPDATVRFDYSTSPPQLLVKRRGAMTALTFAVGSTGSERVERCDIAPLAELEVQRVELKHMSRQAGTGKPKWASQNHGTLSASSPHKVQIVAVSGPEVLAMVPKNEFESVLVQTANNAYPGPATVRKSAGSIAANTQEFGNSGGIITAVSAYVGGSWQYTRLTWFSYPSLKIRKRNGDPVSLSGRYFLISEDLPDWARKQLGAVDVKVTGTWGGVWTETDTIKSPSEVFRKWRDAAPIRGSGIANEYSSLSSAKAYSKLWYAMPFELEGVLIGTQYASATRIYKTWDYDFIDPPDGLAQNLQGAQDFIPWQGPVTIVGRAMDGVNLLHRPLNITGGHPDMATMKALSKSVTYDFGRQRIDFDLGPPPRLDLGGLVQKMRRQPQDYIVLRNPNNNIA